MSPNKETTNTVGTNYERTANTAVSSNFGNHSVDDDDLEQFFDYDQFRQLRRIENINEIYKFGRIIGQGTYG